MIVLNLIGGEPIYLDWNFTLSELVKATRTAMALKQYEFASLLGLCGQSAVSRVEKGRAVLRNEAFIKLLKLYDYNAFCIIVGQFAKPVSITGMLAYIPLYYNLWIVGALIGNICDGLNVSRLRVAKELGIKYPTLLKMSKGDKVAGNYNDICIIMSSFMHRSDIYKALQTY